MPRAYDQGVVDEARRLFVVEELEVSDIVRRLSIPLSTVRRWADRGKWDVLRNRQQRKNGELDSLLDRIKLCLARMVLAEDGSAIAEAIDLKQINAVCRAVAVLSPPASVLLKKLEKEEAETEPDSVEDRMARVMELLKGAGFVGYGDVRP